MFRKIENKLVTWKESTKKKDIADYWSKADRQDLYY